MARSTIPRLVPFQSSRSWASARPQPRAKLSLARVLERRIDLDIQALGRLGVEVGVGAVATGMDAVDGAEVVDLVDVAGDPQRAHDLPAVVTDQLAAGFQEQGPVGELGERLYEGRFLLRLLQHLPRGAVERERAEGLAVGDLEAHQRGAVLLLERLHAATGVEHDRGERVGLALLS